MRARHLGVGELSLPGQWLDDVRNHVVQGPTADEGLESVVEAPELPTLNGTAWTPRALLRQAKRSDRSKPCVAKMLRDNRGRAIVILNGIIVIEIVIVILHSNSNINRNSYSNRRVSGAIYR